MSSTRNYNIRHGDLTQDQMRNKMEYPFSCIGEEDTWSYSKKDIRRPILLETEEELADSGNFPNNISYLYWVREGENDGDEWIALGDLENGAFFFYTGSCDYTGFDCQGGMNLWVSKKFENIIDHAMSEAEYQLYLQQTEEIDPHEDLGKCAHCGEEATLPNDMTEDGNLCADCFWDLREDMKRGRMASRYNENIL